MAMLKHLTILPCLFMLYQPKIQAKVEAPNYNFSLDTLNDFSPRKKTEEIQKKYGKPEVMNQRNGLSTLKYYVSHIRYKFPVLVQERDGVIQDSFARLPNYFLHDLFFQSLVNRYGKQTSYKKVGEEAFYVWDTETDRHVYSAACTITCFPIFYTVHPKGMANPLIEQMRSANRK